MFPADVKTDAEKLWYMRNFLGLNLKEIGERIHYSQSGAEKAVKNCFLRQSQADIYKKVTQYCKTMCDSEVDCRQCQLHKFVVAKMLRGKMR